MTNRTTPVGTVDEELVERLNDEAMRLQGRGIDQGCVDSSLAGNLAMEAATLIEQLLNRVERQREALEQLEGKARLGGDCLGNSPPNFKPCQDSFYMLADLARAALTGEHNG